MIFRNDDVSINTDILKLNDFYSVLSEAFPDCEIWSGVSLFAERNTKGSVYKDIPFKNNPPKWFYQKADHFLEIFKNIPGKIVSHGLYHVDHSKLSFDAQEMSIVGSCKYLRTKIFVPPFNRFNQHTLVVCMQNRIDLSIDGWKSLECEPFNPDHKKWYFHSWKYTPEKLKEVLIGKCANVG